jgi:type IV secretory pathway VirD2 relaxase
MSEFGIDAALGVAVDSGKVRRKGNNTRHLRSTAKRVVSGSPEVMVKITGFGKGAGHIKAHLDYISRNGKLELETDRGEYLNGKAAVAALLKDWQSSVDDSKRRANQRDTAHIVLSMPKRCISVLP